MRPLRFPNNRDGVAIITYREDGKEKEWSVGALIGADDESTMRAHLAKWKPQSEFISVKFEAVMSEVLLEVGDELERARKVHGPMAGYHEGYAVILEEVDELWELVKRNTHKRDGFTKKDKLRLLRKEAIQIAAMAVRFVEDVCDREIR